MFLIESVKCKTVVQKTNANSAIFNFYYKTALNASNMKLSLRLVPITIGVLNI